MKSKLGAIVMTVLLSGCGSIMNFDYWDRGPKVYGGVRIDVEGHCWNDRVVGFVDLPFSFVVDTAFLPIYLVFEGFRG